MLFLAVRHSGGFSVLKKLAGPEEGLIGIGDIDRYNGGKFIYTPCEHYDYLSRAQNREIKIILLTLNE